MEKLEFLISEEVEKRLIGLKRLNGFLKDVDEIKPHLPEFCKLYNYSLLCIDVTYENGDLEPEYVFLTTPSDVRPEGIEAYTFKGIVNSLIPSTK